MSQTLREERLTIAVIVALVVLRTIVATDTLLSADEAYYWQWTRPLRLSYYDHPAMVAVWIWAGVHLIGQTELGVRMPSLLTACAVTVVIWDATRLSFASRRAGFSAALWINCTVLFAIGGIVITPDSPLLLFWSLCLWAVLRLIVEEKTGYLYLAGLALGLGAISKYTIALLVPGLLVTFLLFPSLRKWWRGPHLYLAVLLALVCMTPLILWNLANHGASFHKQLSHAFADTGAGIDRIGNLTNFLASQIGLVTPLVFVFCLWGMGWSLWMGWLRRRPEWFLLGATSLPVLAFFVLHTQSGLVQAHWSGPAYLGGIMATAGAWTTVGDRRRWYWAFAAAPALALVMSLTVLLQAATALLPIPTKIDALKRLGGWKELAAAVETEREIRPGLFLFTQKHEPTGSLTFYLPDHPVVFLIGAIRPSYYTAEQVNALKGHDGLMVSRAREDGANLVRDKFARVTLLRQVVLHWRDHPADAYNLYLAEGYRGGAFVMGDGWNGTLDAP